jgi:hypothetical protein
MERPGSKILKTDWIGAGSVLLIMPFALREIRFPVLAAIQLLLQGRTESSRLAGNMEIPFRFARS